VARKLYVYDDEARRQLDNRKFSKEFKDHKPRYVSLARKLYAMLATQPGRPPLKADVQGLLGEYLYAEAEFTALILKLVGSLETRHAMWCGCFAAMVIDQAWDEITAGDNLT
jgi:hypothetical protein